MGSFGSMAYYNIGDKLGDAFSVGNELKQNDLKIYNPSISSIKSTTFR